MQILYYLLKFSSVIYLLYNLPLVYAIPSIILLYILYHSYIIPLIYNVMPMNSFDTFMLYETPLNRAHWACVSYYERRDFSDFFQVRSSLIKKFPKLRSNVTNIYGTNYWTEITVEQAEKGIIKLSNIHTKDEIIQFLNQDFHNSFPKDGPLWKLYIIDDYSYTQSVHILITHHVLYDGLSHTFMSWSTGQEDITLLPPLRAITLKEKIFLHFALFYTLPLTTYNILQKQIERNPINNGKTLTGVKKTVFYDDIPFDKIKENYKKANCTLNDYFIAVLSKSLKEYFKLKEPNKEFKSVSVGFPLNLREKFPKKHDEVVLENNITAADVTIPLINDVNMETNNISKILNNIKNSGLFFANVYFLKLGLTLLPQYLMSYVNIFITSKTTIALSNVPFFRKNLVLKGLNCSLVNEVAFINNNSDIGVALAVSTYGQNVGFSICADVARLPEPNELADIYRKNLISG